MPQQFIILIVAAVALLVIGGASFLSGRGSLDSIKSKPVGDGQRGTARWATPQEISKTFARVPFKPAEWRQGKELPCAQGLALGSQGKKGKDHRPGGQRRHPLPDDRCVRRGQDGLFPIPQPGVRLCLRHELPGPGHQGRPGPQLRGHRPKLLWLRGVGERPAQSHPLGRIQLSDAGEHLRGQAADRRGCYF